MTVRQEKQFCANCGTLLKENAKFCPMCGNVVNSFKKTSDSVEEAAVPVKSTKEPKKNRRKKVIIISSIIIVGIIVLLGIIGGLYGDESEIVDIGEAATGRDFMQKFISENDYLEVSAGMYESPDKQVNVYLDERGIPEKVIISGGSTKIYGIGIGDTFTLEKTGKTLTSHGYGYFSDDEMSLTYSAEITEGKSKSIQLFLNSDDDKIYNIIYFISDNSVDILEESIESSKVDETIIDETTEGTGMADEETAYYISKKDTFLWESMEESITVCKVPQGEMLAITDDCGNGWFYAIYGDYDGFILGLDIETKEDLNRGVSENGSSTLEGGSVVEESTKTAKAISGRYQLKFDGGGAELEIMYSSEDDLFYAYFSGSMEDYSGETSGFLSAYTDGSDGLWDYYEEDGYTASMRLSYDEFDSITVVSLDGNTFGGMQFPGFEGSYTRTEEYLVP